MVSIKSSRRGIAKIIRREYADRYILLALISFAGSISVTRLFLSLSGYPRIESGNLHIAHVLWGGLLLFAASLLPLIFANRWIYSIGALLGGVGIGLFIDEVGKFITVTNDYFFPAAAPIIYVFFLLTVLVLIQIRMMRDHNENNHIHKALDKIHDILEDEVSPKEQKELAEQIELLMQNEQPGKKRDLEKTIVEFLKIDIPEIEKKDSPKRKILNTISSILLKIWKFISTHIRTILILGTFGIGLLNLKNPASYLLHPILPENIAEILEMNIGRQVNPVEAAGFYEFRVWSEITIGLLMIFSAALLMTKHRFAGCLIGITSFLLCLMVIDFILFYFEQFSTIITTSIQFLLFLGYLYYLTKLTAKPGRLVQATIKPY